MENKLLENSNFIMYTTNDGQVEIEVRLEDENVWLTQKAMAGLFDTTKQNISLHINNIFEESRYFFDTDKFGKKNPNIDFIISFSKSLQKIANLEIIKKEIS